MFLEKEEKRWRIVDSVSELLSSLPAQPSPMSVVYIDTYIPYHGQRSQRGQWHLLLSWPWCHSLAHPSTPPSSSLEIQIKRGRSLREERGGHDDIYNGLDQDICMCVCCHAGNIVSSLPFFCWFLPSAMSLNPSHRAVMAPKGTVVETCTSRCEWYGWTIQTLSFYKLSQYPNILSYSPPKNLSGDCTWGWRWLIAYLQLMKGLLLSLKMAFPTFCPIAVFERVG